jgi:hypothetical protein
LETLNYLLEGLNFAEINIVDSSSSLEDEKESRDDVNSPIECLWPSVKAIYTLCSKLGK